MKRRTFIAGLGSAATWPVVTWGQQAPVPVIGFLSTGSPNDISYHGFEIAYRRGLKEVGFVDGQNVVIEFRYADARYDRLPTMAADLVRRRVAVISAGGDVAAIAAKAATATIPIVFTSGDNPVKLGLVASLNRPAGNATGVNLQTDQMEAKRLSLLHALLPKPETIAVLLNPNYPGLKTELEDLQRTSRAIGRQITWLNASSEGEIDTAFDTLVQQRVGGLFVGADIFFQLRREQLIALAARHAIPTIYHDRSIVAAGGLMSYGISIAEGYRQAGNYVGRILKGETAADLPVIQPTKFEVGSQH